MTSKYRLRLEAKFESNLITRKYQTLTSMLTNISGSSKAIMVGLAILFLFKMEYKFKKHLMLSFYNVADPKLPESYRLKKNFDRYQKWSKDRDLDLSKLTEKQKSKLQVFVALKKIYNERLDIVSNLRSRTVNNVITEALLNEEQKKLLPLAYINKREIEKKNGNTAVGQLLSLEESLD